MPSTGVAITWISAVAYIDQTNSGSWNQPMPGSAQLVNGGDEVDAR